MSIGHKKLTGYFTKGDLLMANMYMKNAHC